MGPVDDVVREHLPAHRGHALAGLGVGHVPRVQHGGLEPVDVVRVDEHRLLELLGGAGELREHESTRAVLPGRDVLLGHEVHPVPQGRDEHDVRGEVQGHHLLERVAVVQVADGGVGNGVELAVDPPHHALHEFAQLPVGVHALARRARDLDEHRVLHGDLPVLEQLAVGLDAVPDALGVVQAVHSQEHGVRVAQLLADLPRPGLDLRVRREFLDGFHVDRDGVRARVDGPLGALAVRRVLGEPGAALGELHPQVLAHAALEVLGVPGALEADQVRTRETFQHGLAPRQLGVDLGGRERDVVEEPDGHVRAQPTQHARHQLQLVVLDPHGRTLGGRLRGPAREALVDATVGVPPRAVELGRRDDVMVQRPQRGVREALVVALDLELGQAHRHEMEDVVVERLQRLVRGAVPPHPRAAALGHHGCQGAHQPAGGAAPRAVAVLVHVPVHGKTVGHHHEVVAVLRDGHLLKRLVCGHDRFLPRGGCSPPS